MADKRTDELIIKDIKDLKYQITHFNYRNKDYQDLKQLITILKSLIEELGLSENERVRGDVEMTLPALKHTLNKEVALIAPKYQAKMKKNAAAKRTQEYYDSIVQTIKQINEDLIFLSILYAE